MVGGYEGRGREVRGDVIGEGGEIDYEEKRGVMGENWKEKERRVVV